MTTTLRNTHGIHARDQRRAVERRRDADAERRADRGARRTPLGRRDVLANRAAAENSQTSRGFQTRQNSASAPSERQAADDVDQFGADVVAPGELHDGEDAAAHEHRRPDADQTRATRSSSPPATPG